MSPDSSLCPLVERIASNTATPILSCGVLYLGEGDFGVAWLHLRVTGLFVIRKPPELVI